MKPAAWSFVVLALVGCTSGRPLPTPQRYVDPLRQFPPSMARGESAAEDDLRGTPPSLLPGQAWPKLASAESRLPNGVRIATVARRDFPSVACTFALDRGAADVPPGAALVYASTLHGSSEDYDRQEANRYLQFVGARVTTSLSFEGTFLRVSALTPLFVSAVSRAAPKFLAPKLAAADMDRARTSLMAQRRLGADEPREQAFAELYATLFPGTHPYAVERDGGDVDLDKLHPKVVAQLRDLYLAPEHVIVACAGDLEHARMVRLLTPYLERLTPKPERPRTDVSAPAARPEGAPILIVDRPDASQATVVLGWVVPEGTSLEMPAIEVLANATGVGLSSRLNLTARRELGATYGVHTSVSRRRGASVATIDAAIETPKVEATVARMLAELARLGRGDLEPEELASAKIRAARRGADTSSEGLATALAAELTLGGSAKDMLSGGERLANVSAEDVRAAARWMAPGNARIVVVGDAAKLEAPLRALGRPVERAQRRRSGRP